MQTALRQRLVGALVLICIFAILWPLLFSQDVSLGLDHASQIPPAPDFEKFTIESAQEPVNIPEVIHYQAEPTVESVESSPAKEVVQPTESDPANTSFTEQGLPVYWALQLASFSQKEKAEKLKKLLLAKGYKVKTQTVKADSGDMIRVYVGPKIDKRVLEQLQPTINKEFKVQSLLVRFSPR